MPLLARLGVRSYGVFQFTRTAKEGAEMIDQIKLSPAGTGQRSDVVGQHGKGGENLH